MGLLFCLFVSSKYLENCILCMNMNTRPQTYINIIYRERERLVDATYEKLIVINLREGKIYKAGISVSDPSSLFFCCYSLHCLVTMGANLSRICTTRWSILMTSPIMTSPLQCTSHSLQGTPILISRFREGSRTATTEKGGGGGGQKERNHKRLLFFP